MRRKRLKKYLLIILILTAITITGTAHIASIIVPVKFQTVLLGEFEQATGKKILLRSVSFNIFRGLVLDGVVIYDKTGVFARAQSISAYVVFPEIINKKIIVPFVKIEKPQITAVRGPDGTFNLTSLIPKDYAPPEGLDLILRRIVIRRGSVIFIDKKPELSFKTSLRNFSADIRLHLPARIIYDTSFDIPGKTPTVVSVQGEYMIPENSSRSEARLHNITPALLGPYIKAAAFRLPEGLIDADVAFNYTPGQTTIRLSAKAKDLTIAQELVRARMSAIIKADMLYTAAAGKWIYSGSAGVSSMDIEGVEGLGAIEKIKGIFQFDNAHLWCDTLDASVFGIPWKVRVNLANFASPIIDIYADFEGKLGAFQRTLCESCRMELPVEFAGDARIKMNISLEKEKPIRMNGQVDFRDVTMRLGSGLYPVEHISGQAQFTPQKLEWSELNLYYRDMAFKTSGTVTNFSEPEVRLKALSRDLSLDAAFSMNGMDITLPNLKGRYLDSVFFMTGALNIKDPAGIIADVRGTLDIDLKDLRYAMGNSAGVRKMKPSGRLKAEFALSGNTSHFFDCTFHAKAKAKALSLYGAHLSDAALDYAQQSGIGEVKTFNAKCYGGVVNAGGKINWRAKAQPYSFSIKAQDIVLESLKADTGFKGAGVSGDIKAYMSLNGYFKDVTRLSGVGRLTITDGRLWELDLFKGVGRSVFTSDFSSIIFSEGSCDFKIADQVFFADSIDLRGDIMRLSGFGMIGFDKSIEGILRPEINENAMWPGTQRNIAMAVQRGTAIEITGTLKDPRFKTRTDLLTVAGALLSSE